MARLPYFDLAKAPPSYTEMLGQRKPLNLYRMLPHAGKAGKGFLKLSGEVLHENMLDARLREVAIFRVGLLSGSAYEVHQHRHVARKVGLSNAKLAALKIDADTAALDEAEKMVLAFTDQLVNHVKASDEMCEATTARFSEGEVTELVPTIGFYIMVSRFLENFEVDIKPRIAITLLRNRPSHSPPPVCNSGPSRSRPMPTPAKAIKASIKDVAVLAGVSLGSVSRVINKFDNVSPEVRDKVMRAITALDYRLNLAAQTLRSRTSMTVGCMLTDVSNPLYASLYRVFEAKFRAAGYMILLANSLNNSRWEVDILSMFRNRGMDGVLIAPGNERNAAVVSAVNQLGIPAVILDRDMATSHDHVQFDHVHGVKQAVLHLLDQGHRQIAVVVAATSSRPMRRRVEGFRAAFTARRLKADPGLIVKLPTSTSIAFDPVTALLKRSDRPTAILALGTSVLGDVLNAVSAQGLRVPRDISIVSMGDPDFARAHVPSLSTVSVDLNVAATESSRILLERMHGVAGDGTRKILIPTEFVLRDSCGPVPRG